MNDPDNYLTYFRRATVYLALGKSKLALPDLDKSIQLRPGFAAVSVTLISLFNMFEVFANSMQLTHLFIDNRVYTKAFVRN